MIEEVDIGHEVLMRQHGSRECLQRGFSIPRQPLFTTVFIHSGSTWHLGVCFPAFGIYPSAFLFYRWHVHQGSAFGGVMG